MRPPVLNVAMSGSDPADTAGGIDRRDLCKALGLGALGAAGFGGATSTAGAQDGELEIEYLFLTTEGGDTPQEQFVDEPGVNAEVVFGFEMDVADPPIAYQLVVVRQFEDGIPQVVGFAFDDATASFAGNVTPDRGGQLEHRKGVSMTGLGPTDTGGAPKRYEMTLVATNLMTGRCVLKSTPFEVVGEGAATGNATEIDAATGNETEGNASVTR